MSYFVLQSNVKLEKGQSARVVKGCKDKYFQNLPPVFPNENSILAGRLEWLIPDEPFNRDHARKVYPSFNILEQGEEVGKVKESVSKRLAPQAIAKLKSEITEKLTGMGIEVPQNSTLPELQALLEAQ